MFVSSWSPTSKYSHILSVTSTPNDITIKIIIIIRN